MGAAANSSGELIGQLYLFNNYNVIQKYSGSNTVGKSLLASIVNEVIEGTNELDHLPQYIIFLLDKDMVEFVPFGGFGCKIIFEKSIEWISHSVENAISTRKEDLKLSNAGAFELGEPCLVWVKMLTRPFIKNTNKGFAFAQCHTYNTILQSTILKFLDTHILDTEIPCDRDFFDLAGNLSPIGKQFFWKEINYWMHRFDRGKTELRPSTDQRSKENNTSQVNKEATTWE